MTDAARTLGRPELGFYTMRLVKGGPIVPAVIYQPCPFLMPGDGVDPDDWFTPQDRSWCYQRLGRIADDPADADLIWERSRARIGAEEYRHLMAVRDWAVKHRPDMPEAEPRKQVRLAEMRPLF